MVEFRHVISFTDFSSMAVAVVVHTGCFKRNTQSYILTQCRSSFIVFSFDLSVVHMGCCDSSGGSDHAHGRRQSGGRHWAASANPQGEISHYFVLVFVFCFNNNHRSFMLPHLIRALSAYKDISLWSFHHARLHTHMHIHYKYMHYWQWVSHTHAHSLLIHALLAKSL